MSSREISLYHEEQRQALIDLNIGIKNLQTVLEQDKPVQLSSDATVSVSNQRSDITVANLDEVIKSLQTLSRELTEAIAKHSHKPTESVTVKNIQEAKIDSVKVDNLIDIKKYLEPFIRVVSEVQPPVVNVSKQELVLPKSAKDAIPVRLSDGKSFYTALMSAVSMGVDSDGIISAINSSGSGKATDAYSFQAESDDGTYTYYWFEDADKNYYIRRAHQTTLVHTFTKGTGGYESVYQSAILGPSGSPIWDSYGDTF